MKAFFKIFFASLLALFIFSLIAFFLLVGVAATVGSDKKPELGDNGILVLDLGQRLKDFPEKNYFSKLSNAGIGNNDDNVLSLHDVVNAIEYAAKDDAVKGLYIKATNASNGLAIGDELRRAIAEFKRSKKFVIAYGATMTEGAYYVAAESDKVYTHPNGGLEWKGFSTTLMFFKGLLDKLQIQPEIFYAGKFKSATEPFRSDKMTDANRLQTTVFLNDMYGNYLKNISLDRNIDSSTLFQLANNGSVQTANDALKNKLVDGLKYNDEVSKELSSKSGQKEDKDPNLIPMDKYLKAVDKDEDGKDKIAVVYAEGDIVDGAGKTGSVGSDAYINILRKARLDKSVKAIVLRVNSPGGSALASDMIWREVTLAKKEKPVIVSMGTYAASGGYYISCNGSYIFAEPNTITGSIGVFAMMINPSAFLGNKLGITFDGVKTAQYADLGSAARPMTLPEKNFMQAGVDSIYQVFLNRVANGRHMAVANVDSIAQGRVWTGRRAIKIGLVDKIGNLNDAIAYAGNVIKSKDYSIKEYPKQKDLLEQLFGITTTEDNNLQDKAVQQILGDQSTDMLHKIKSIIRMCNVPQTRMPFELDIQ